MAPMMTSHSGRMPTSSESAGGSGGRGRDGEAGQQGGGVHIPANEVDQGDQPFRAEGLVRFRVQVISDRVVQG